MNMGLVNKNILIAIITIIAIAVSLGLALLYLDKTQDQGQDATPVLKSGENGSSLDNRSPDINNKLPESDSLGDEKAPPISQWQERITKKPFGIKISPDNSFVQPERFSGYHTGVDFETFPEEADKEVEVFAVCGGTLLAKQNVSGYGGVTVQSCLLDGQNVTVIYGHLKLSSIAKSVGQPVLAEEKIGVLGKGFSQETDGERKHLHLGIHKGKEINFKGYVQAQEELNNWLDATKYLK